MHARIASRFRARAGALAMMVALGSTWPAVAQSDTAAPASEPVLITITDGGCQPSEIAVPAGKAAFKIKNASRRAVEWEILQGTMVIEERENIVPGFVQPLTATLDAGEYQMTCGLLSNPKGVLKVATTAASAEQPSVLALVGPMSEYKLYVAREVDALVAATRGLTDAVKAGKLDGARQLYAPAHLHYERIEPIAELFNDLDGSMDSREDDFEKKAADPNFLGFHRIEKGLFADRSTADLAPVADKLMADALDLRKRIATLSILPKNMVGGAADLIEEVASKKLTGEEDRYSHTDLWDFQANLDGAQKIVTLLAPLLKKRDPALGERVKSNFAAVDALLTKYRANDGSFASYEKVTEEDRLKLRRPITTLAEDLAKLRGTLGID